MLSLFCGGAARKQLYKLVYVFLHGIICNQVDMQLLQFGLFLFFFLQLIPVLAWEFQVLVQEGTGKKGQRVSQNTAREWKVLNRIIFWKIETWCVAWSLILDHIMLQYGIRFKEQQVSENLLADTPCYSRKALLNSFSKLQIGLWHGVKFS